MATSGKDNALMASLVIVMVLLGACASVSSGALQIQSNALNSTFTVLNPPGCCGDQTACEQCADVVVAVGQLVTLDSHVGPYPLQYLKFQLLGMVYCVASNDLNFIAATSIVYVVESAGDNGRCGTTKTGFYATVVDNTTGVLQSVCLNTCAA